MTPATEERTNNDNAIVVFYHVRVCPKQMFYLSLFRRGMISLVSSSFF
jgi:hypothetical protein